MRNKKRFLAVIRVADLAASLLGPGTAEACDRASVLGRLAVYQATPTQIAQYNDQPTRDEAYSFGSAGIQLTQTTAHGVPERARALVVRSRLENRHILANRISLASSLQ